MAAGTVTHVRTNSTHPFPLLAHNSAPEQRQKNFRDDRQTGIDGVFSHSRSVTRGTHKTKFIELDSLNKIAVAPIHRNYSLIETVVLLQKDYMVIEEKPKDNPKNATRREVTKSRGTSPEPFPAHLPPLPAPGRTRTSSGAKQPSRNHHQRKGRRRRHLPVPKALATSQARLQAIFAREKS